MEKYRVLENFKDLQDNNNVYLKNVKGKDVYPREGLEPTKNKLKKVLIEKIEESTEGKEEKTE